MSLLLDKNMTHRLRPVIVGHESATVSYMGWSSKHNGELLALAADAGFDALVTNDANLLYQQNPSTLPIAVVVLRTPSNDLEDIRPLIPALLVALDNLPPCAVTVVS